MIDADAATIIGAELEAGETILWAARPDPNRALTRNLAGCFIGVPFAAFALFWMMGASFITRAGGSFFGPFAFFPLFGVPFVLVGLYLIATPFIAANKAKGGAYAVTDRRAILIESGTSRSVRSFAPRDIGTIERREHANGTGDVIFARQRMNGSRGGSYFNDIGFFGVPDAREAERLLRQLNAPRGG